MKTLVIVAHPNLEKSVVNRRWAEELEKHPDRFTVHRLYGACPDERIDVAREQALVQAHGALLFQFPIYWFGCPSLLKKWMDSVLAFGWAFGPQPEADKMRGRKVALAVSAGIKQEDFSPNGKYGHTLEELLWPFETLCRYVEADYRGFHALYGAEDGTPQPALEANAQQYLHFAAAL